MVREGFLKTHPPMLMEAAIHYLKIGHLCSEVFQKTKSAKGRAEKNFLHIHIQIVELWFQYNRISICLITPKRHSDPLLSSLCFIQTVPSQLENWLVFFLSSPENIWPFVFPFMSFLSVTLLPSCSLWVLYLSQTNHSFLPLFPLDKKNLNLIRMHCKISVLIPFAFLLLPSGEWCQESSCCFCWHKIIFDPVEPFWSHNRCLQLTR